MVFLADFQSIFVPNRQPDSDGILHGIDWQSTPAEHALAAALLLAKPTYREQLCRRCHHPRGSCVHEAFAMCSALQSELLLCRHHSTSCRILPSDATSAVWTCGRWQRHAVGGKDPWSRVHSCGCRLGLPSRPIHLPSHPPQRHAPDLPVHQQG